MARVTGFLFPTQLKTVVCLKVSQTGLLRPAPQMNPHKHETPWLFIVPTIRSRPVSIDTRDLHPSLSIHEGFPFSCEEGPRTQSLESHRIQPVANSGQCGGGPGGHSFFFACVNMLVGLRHSQDCQEHYHECSHQEKSWGVGFNFKERCLPVSDGLGAWVWIEEEESSMSAM